MSNIFLLKQVIIICASALSFAAILVHALFLLELLQRNEYRIDRLKDFFSTFQGKRVKLFYSLFFIITGASLILILDVNQHKILTYLLLLFFAFIFFDLLKTVKAHKLFRPTFTKKIQVLLLGPVGIAIASYIIFWLETPKPIDLIYILFALTLLITLTLGLTILAAFVLQPITYVYKQKEIKKAKEKMKQFPNVIVVGITGSYGKTSVKEFLSTILEEKFNVLKTKEHTNTEIGVAQTVVNELNKEHEIFVVEMGAYTKGEIRKICEIVSPKIGILTAIDKQHLSLFGSQENIKKAKKELIDSLPENGFAVINADNVHTLDIYNTISIPKLSYSLQGNGEVNAQDIKADSENMSFSIQGKEYTTTLRGIHNIANLLACISVARHLDMTDEQIQKGMQKLTQPKNTLEVKKGKNNVTIIDDTYNANPKGVLAALEYVKTFEKTKHLVMPSLRELGNESEQIHFELAKEMAPSVDYFYYNSQDYIEQIVEGFKEYPQKLILIETQKQLKSQIQKRLKSEDVILFESRGAQGVIDELL